MTDEELNKAAEEYAGLYFDRQTEYKSFWHDVDTFKAVAEWMKRQMMEEAVEGTYDSYPAAVYLDIPIPQLKHGDKVHIIILKEDKNETQ